MKKTLKYKHIFVITVLLGLFTNINIIKAENYLNDTKNFSTNEKPSENVKYSKYDYVIDKYDVNIIVNENNTYDITETITAYFNVPKHGIYRTIPLENTITRLNGTSSNNKAQIYNLSVNNNYSVSKSRDTYEIKIGSSNKVLLGEQTYIIKYTYNIGKDPLDNIDELYLNIIGNEWDTVIGNITFKIAMPKSFDKTKLGFSSGRKGLIENSLIEYSIDGLVIIGKYNGILNSNEAVTVRCELEDGYFVNARLKLTILNCLQLIVPLLSLIIAVILWYKFGKDDKTIETVEFYPPEGINSLELAKVYKGEAKNTDITSLLIYLASKGYIEIIDNNESHSIFNKNKKYLIKKIKNYDGSNIYESMFMKGLFKNNKTEVTEEMLKNKFYLTINLIAKSLKENYKDKIYENNSRKNKLITLLIIISLFSYSLAVLPLYIINGDISDVLALFVMSTLSFAIMFVILLAFRNEHFINKVPAIIVLLLFGVVPLFIFFSDILESKFYIKLFIYGVICIIGIIICIALIPKRTDTNNKLVGRIKGFKKFLITAEKDRLNNLVVQNPQYFYDILPYTYVLGISNKWIKKFKDISMSAPTWYKSQNNFSTKELNNFISGTIKDFQRTMVSSPNNSSGGNYSSSSGGGSSGGGSGGGGGGAW